jgi:hypothetical protein
MNEQLKQLAEQANLKLDDLPDSTFIPLDKFAELIVRECAKQVKHLHKQGGGTYGETILKHFGIKP